ncbi:MAG: hypothetical protein AAB449_03820 [Patescibacteria group bacterium]
MSKATFGQAFQALNLIHAKDPSSERLDALYGSGILSDLLDPAACLDRDSIRKALKLGAVTPEQLTLSVDYGRSLDQMIAAGNYDWKSDDITAEKFLVVVNGVEQFEARIFHFDSTMPSGVAVEAIKAAGFEPGKIEHLLSFGEKYPEEQRKYPIIALGSVAEVNGNRYVSYLCRFDARRSLDIRWWGFDWSGRYRFLAVRKLSSAPQA